MYKQKIIYGENIHAILFWLNNINAKKIFLLTGNDSFVHSGAKTYLAPILNKYSYFHFSDFKENPQLGDVYKGIEKLNTKNCDCCIAIGGGSVMDMAKLICYLNKEKTNNPELIIKNQLSSLKRQLPLCAIPTTAGSGAESTHFAVVYINKIKYSLAHDTILPDFVNLNPKISFTTSPYIKAITGLDALAQGIESFWSKNATLESRQFSSSAIEFIWKNLKKSVIENDFEAHTKVVLGSNLAGRAINVAKTTACHAISYYFTSNHNIKHGHAVSLTLGNLFQFNDDKARQSKNEIKSTFEELRKLLQIKENPKIVIERFIIQLGIDIDYVSLKIDINKELPSIIKDVNCERLSNNPFIIKTSDFNKIIK